MITERKGDLLQAQETIIGHQVNCKGVMGAGVAKQIRLKLLSEQQFKTYQNRCKTFGLSMLGSCYLDKVSEGHYVAHIFGENIPTGKGLDTDYTALEAALRELRLTARQHQYSIAIPGFLGCGLAGGNWEYVCEYILKLIFEDYPYGLAIVYNMQSIRMLWSEFGDVPMNPKTERIESRWHGFKRGTHREEIWRWFEDTFDISVAKDLMHQ